MNDKIKQLGVKRLLQEYNYLLVDDEYKKEVIDSNRSGFLTSIENMKIELGIQNPEPEIPTESKNISPKKSKIEDIDDRTKSKLKKIYRDIVKITHPDKLDSEKYLDTYIRAKDAYAENDLLELYLICLELNIEVEIETEDLDNIMNIITLKRNELSNIESSFLWLWAHAKTEEMKNSIVLNFINKHVNK